MAEHLLEVNESNFTKDVLESKVPVVVDFWAEWCMPCKMLSPVVDELAGEYTEKIKFVKIDVDNNTQLATNLQILSIPALLIFKNGKEAGRIVGANAKSQIKKEIEAILSK
ncbi:MAG: thioredoxin [Candidatus Omnitrophota bacterium]